MKPQKSPADLADLRRQTPKTPKPNQQPSQPVFLCEIIQLCCIPLRHLRYLRENIHARVLNQLAQNKPQEVSADLSLIYADETKTAKHLNQHESHNHPPTCLSLRNNAACCIPLRHLRYLRENIHKEYSIY